MSNKLPSVTSSIPRDLRAFLDRLREVVSGGSDDRLVTAKDLIDAGVVVPGPGATLLPPPQPIVGTPPAPTNLQAAGAIQNIILSWDNPQYPGHDYAEVWGSATNVIGDAALLGLSPGATYVDSVGPSVNRYYWVRFVNVLGTRGPYNAVDGVLGQTGADVDYLLSTLSGQITESQLFAPLNARINLVDAPVTTPGSVNARLAVVQSQVNDLLSTPDYDNAVTYQENALVQYNGAIYQALQTTTGNLPTNTTYWIKIGDYSSLGQAVAAQATQITTLTTDLAAETAARTTLASAVNDPTTGLAATRSTLLTDYYTKTAADSATSSAITALSSSINNTLTGYVTNATLTNDYYTKTQADNAISQATSTLVSTTALNNALGNYTNTATLQDSYYTKTATDSAITTATQDLVSNTALNNALGNYTTTANLQTNYYTKTQTDSAITQATLNLVSTTALNNALNNYTNTATLQTDYYTKTATDSAISAATMNLVSTTALNTALGNYTTTANLQQDYYTKSGADTAISNATLNLVSTTALNTALGNYTTTAALQTNYYTKASGQNLEAQYTVKTDLAGRVAGFGLASSGTVADGTTSEFGVVADRFFVAAPNDYTQEAQPTAGVTTGKVWYKPSTKQTFRFDGSSWVAFSPVVPFVVQTTPTVINGVSVPAGVYMDAAYIRDGTITAAKIGNAAIDDAKIATLSAGKLTAGSITAGQYIQSANFVSGTQGWYIGGNGVAEFGAAAIRGQLTASQIDTRGLSIKDLNGNIILAAGTPLAAANVSGLGTLATKNTVSAATEVTGLGALATQNSVNWDTQLTNVPAFGNFAYLSSITSANISTYIASGAIGEAYIANAAITTAKIGDAQITAAKIGNAEVQTLKIAGNAVTVPAFAQLTTTLNKSGYIGLDTIVSATVNTAGNPVVVVYSVEYLISNTTSASASYPLEVRVGDSVIRTITLFKPSNSGASGYFQGTAFIASPATGDLTVRLALNINAVINNTITFYAPRAEATLGSQPGTYFYTLGTKR